MKTKKISDNFRLINYKVGGLFFSNWAFRGCVFIILKFGRTKNSKKMVNKSLYYKALLFLLTIILTIIAY